jgi:hypothetical protein
VTLCELDHLTIVAPDVARGGAWGEATIQTPTGLRRLGGPEEA